MLKGAKVLGKFVATSVIGAFFVLAQPAAAQGWSERLLSSVSAWTPWASPAVPSSEPLPDGESAGMFGRAMTATMAYMPALPPLASNVAGQASGLYDRAVLYAKSYGPSFPTLEPDASQSEGWSDTAKQSMGCLLGGTSGIAAALIAGGENLVNVIAGGIVAPANPIALYVGLFGVVFASFCAVGQALTPLYIEYFEAPSPVPSGMNPHVPARPSMLPDARFYYVNAR